MTRIKATIYERVKKNEPLQIHGSFQDVIKVSVTSKPEVKKEEEKPVQKKKKN